MNAAPELLAEVVGHVGVVTLNRPKALNALSLAMLKQFADVLHAWARDAAVHAVLVRGAGERAFCAGGDIRELYDSANAGNDVHKEYFTFEYRLDYLIHQFPKPYVALIDGITMGGGMGISQGAWLRVAGDRTRIAMPETGIGLFPDVGATKFLGALPGVVGVYLGLTGTAINATEAIGVGLADLYLSPYAIETLLPAIAAFPDDVDHGKALLRLIAQRSSTPAQNSALEKHLPGIEKHFAPSTVPLIVDSLAAEHDPLWKDWAETTLAQLKRRSPTMLCVTLEQLKRGHTMTLAQALRMELDLTEGCFSHGDILEGVRALIVDKDNKPRWNPPDLDDVQREDIDAFFVSPWSAQSHPLRDLEAHRW